MKLNLKWGYKEVEKPQNNLFLTKERGKKPLPFFEHSDYSADMVLVYGEFYPDCIEYFFVFQDIGFLIYRRTVVE